MNKFVLFYLVLFTGQQYTVAVLSPSYEHVPEAATWLRLHVAPATWHDARQRCELEGGILASPSSSHLAKAMLSLMTSHKVHRPVFTGIHSLISEGDFMSLDGVPLENIHLDWAPGEPNDQSDGGTCVVLNLTGDVADVSCTSAHPYFCRKENATARFNQECATTATGYEYFASTGSCYKFYRNPTTWHHAAKVCHAEGGHLAIINSKTESELIKEMFKMNPKDVAFVGVLKWRNIREEKWLTIHGQTLKEAGYEQWLEGQPDQYKGLQDCGAIERTGGYIVFAHDTLMAFICEITP